MHSYITAIFKTYTQAEGAIGELRSMGVPDSHLSIVSRHEDYETLGERVVTEDVGEAAHAGLLGGATVGALVGLAAVFIPGAGPILAAGALTTALGLEVATVATGVIAGASAGALAGALAKVGYDEGESRFYSGELELGHVFVSINADQHVVATPSALAAVLARHGGRSANTVVSA